MIKTTLLSKIMHYASTYTVYRVNYIHCMDTNTQNESLARNPLDEMETVAGDGGILICEKVFTLSWFTKELMRKLGGGSTFAE